MYIIIRPQTAETKETLCLVKAKNVEDAKRMAGVIPDWFRWAWVPDTLLAGFASINHGIVEYEF